MVGDRPTSDPPQVVRSPVGAEGLHPRLSHVRWDGCPGRPRERLDGVRVSFENSTVCRVFVCSTRFVGVGLVLCQFVFVCFVRVFVGEFDPGSGRTLAACLTHASRAVRPLRGYTSGERVSNTWVTCPQLWDKPGKLGLILDIHFLIAWWVVESFFGWGWARGLSACWWGDGLPRRRRVAGLRGRPATLGLRHGPDSYGRQQWGILRNGRKPDAATPRGG